jgi:hypothetical protein
MAILKRYAGKKLKKSQFPASTAKVGLAKLVRLVAALRAETAKNAG